MYETREVLKTVDHTILKVDATWDMVRKTIDMAAMNECASACISPCYVSRAFEYVEEKYDGSLPICTVIGFPSGQSTTEVKLYEAREAILDGAREIDMVINISWVKDRRFEEILKEISELENLCHYNNVCGYITLKVIVESCLLTEWELRKMCEIVALSGADFIKTSTGFSTGGATVNDIAIMKEEMDKWNNDKELREKFPLRDKIKIKASGGIKNMEDAKQFLYFGADRLGTSRLL